MWPYQQSSPATLKATIFEQMHKLGADYLEASYSGGNDEGGLDDVVLFKRAAPRKRKDVAERTRKGVLIKYERVQLPEPGYIEYDHALYEALNELLSIDFGTWAGDFSAYGTVYADVLENRVWREGEVSTHTEDSSAGEW